jgi:hypothetical protein
MLCVAKGYERLAQHAQQRAERKAAFEIIQAAKTRKQDKRASALA